MKLNIYQVDAFANEVYQGNPAAVVPLESWIPDETMQQIAAENNLAETAFFVKEDNSESYYIRWFTPSDEVPLCGHATLASAFVLFNCLGYATNEIVFNCKSGELIVSKSEDWICMNFPSQPLPKTSIEERFEKDLGLTPKEAYANDYSLLLVYEKEEDVAAIQPNFRAMLNWKEVAISVTAPSSNYDFVSRLFGPKVAIDEDPVTGSAHTRLIPYWSARLGKKEMFAKQISKRGGEVKCKYLGDRVEMSGKGVLYLKGEIYV